MEMDYHRFFHRFLDYDGYGLGCRHVGYIITLKAAIIVS
jgi:hypothetical protein